MKARINTLALAGLMLAPLCSRAADWDAGLRAMADAGKAAASAKETLGRTALGALYSQRFLLQGQRDALQRGIEEQDAIVKRSMIAMRLYAAMQKSVEPDISKMTDPEVVEAILAYYDLPGIARPDVARYQDYQGAIRYATNSPTETYPVASNAEDAILDAARSRARRLREKSDVERSLKEVNDEIARLTKAK
ncbi:MAG: hypothetical protein HY077_13875 [Elusimicrobia bacterium]|nr:hypothetical protein [Elusimicrobiota bacterium]